MSLFGGRRRDEEAAPEPGAGPGASPGGDRPPAPPGPPRTTQPAPDAGRGERMAHIGKSIAFQGELTGDEDLVVDGRVEGKIELPNHHLTIGEGGQVRAELQAKLVTVVGRVNGNVNASERVEVEASGVVEGDLRAPRLVVKEGAVVNGTIEMASKPTAKPVAVPKPAATPAAARESSSAGA